MSKIIKIMVKPNSSQEKVIKIDEGSLVIYTRAKPHDGEANKRVVEMVAKYLGVTKTSIRIRSGIKSRKKTLEIL